MANSNSGNNGNPQMPYGHASQHTTPTHSPYSSSPSSSTYPASGKAHSSTPLRRYILLPPPKRRRLHKTSDLGFPGVFPQRVGQDEDQMTSSNVKTGYIDKGIIQNETVSAQGILADGLQDPKKLHDLGTFMVEVLKRRQESSKITGPPSRATLNDQKKEQWMSDLSGTVSLRRLSKSVPHGFKSEKLLETLAQRQVPMLRATWYIKIVALSEMQAPRSRPSSTQHQYSTDWTMIVNSFLKKQLLEINPHSTSKPAASALNPASGAQNVKPWASEDAKEKWEAKWRYSVMLTKWQYSEGLLDHRHFLRTTVELLSTLGFEQVALLLNLISMFLSEYARSRLLMRLLIEGLLQTLQSVQKHPSYNQPVFRYGYLELELKRMLQMAPSQSIFLSTPDMFVIPKAWAAHSQLLQQVLLQDMQSTTHKPAVFPNIVSVLETHYKMIHARVHVFTELSSTGPESECKITRSGDNVNTLDRIDYTSNLELVANEYFSECSDGYSTSSIPPSPSKPAFSSTDPKTQPVSPLLAHIPPSQRIDGIWKSRLNTLCEWAITNSRYGHHRVYVASMLLGFWRENPTLSPRIPLYERTSRIQAALLEFLDSFNGSHHHASQHADTAHSHHQQHNHGGEDTLDAVARLFGNLIHDRLFSYQQYLQRLIARGDLQPSKRHQESTLRHLKYLQSFPLPKCAQAHHLNQRRVVLFGVSGEDEYDKACFETITAQIKAKLPYMFSAEAANMTVPIRDSPQNGPELAMPLSVQLTELILSTSRFCQLRVTSQWLLDAVKSYVVKHIQIGEDNWRVMTSPGSSLMNVRQFATVVNVIEVASDFHSLYEVCTWLLEHTSDKALLTYVVNVAKKHYMIWAAMGVLTKFSQAILAKHYTLQAKNVHFKALPRYLAFEAHNVPEDIRMQMEGDLISNKSATTTGTIIPSHQLELQKLLTDPSLTAASSLASNLYSKYGGLSHWPLHLFGECIEALRKLNSAVSDDPMNDGGPPSATANMEIVRATRLYAELLVEMAERVGDGCMNEVVLSWLRLHDSDWMTSVLGKLLPSDGQPVWFLSFMVQLVIQGFCSIEVLVQDMCGVMLSKVASQVQQPSTDHHGDHLVEMHQQQASPDESTLRLCLTMVVLLRLLLLEDAFSNPRASHVYGASHHSLSMEHHAHRLGIPLTIAETHALQTQRYSRLMAMQQQARNEQEGDGAEAATTSSFLAEQRMMLVQFQICRDLVWIESCLPLNHKVLHEIHEYRKDWALSADWLREKCLANVDGAYKMFLQTRQEQQRQRDASDTGDGGDKGNRKHYEVVDRKMMETFQMLVAESHESLLLLDTYGDGAMTPEMIHQRTFRSIFSGVDQWTFDRRKVEFWLLLDNVMMERTVREKQVGLDGSLAKDLNTSSNSVSVSGGMASSEFMMMEGVTMSTGPGSSSQSNSRLGLTDNGIDLESDSLQPLIQIFFQEFVLSESTDKELLGRMLVGMRPDAVEEFIRYGYSILAGNPNSLFPSNVMVVQRPISSAGYVQVVANFHYVMEILMKEGQPAIPLSLVSEESSSQASASGATPSSSTPSASSSQPANNNSNHTAGVLQGLDAAQLENRIGFAKSLLWQLKKFEDRIKFFDVMHAIGCSYEEASRVVQDSETGGAAMEDLLLNASMQRNHLMQSHPHLMMDTGPYQHQRSLQSSSVSSSNGNTAVYLIDLRTSLCLRLRLLVPLLPVILQHPSSSACDLATYVIRLTNLLVSSIVHGQGSEERLFEFCLDMVSCLMDEVLLLSGGLSGGGNESKAMRNDILNQLRTGLPQMTTSIPTVFASRIFRILPFQQHNVYFTGLRVAGNSGAKGAHKEIQPRPWDWLEDCVGDVDQTSNQQPSQSPALGLGLSDSGSTSSGLANGDSGLGGSSSSFMSASSSLSLLASSSSALPSLGDNVNNTSISLTFFGAKQIRKAADGTTYETQFNLGHGGGDDEQELILIEEQQQPCEYDHSHHQHLWMLQHQRKQEQILQQQQQQQILLKQQADAMMKGGQSQDLAPPSDSNMMEMDLFGPGSSEGGVRSGSVPPLPRQHEPDPELEEGQIVNDDDLDMNSIGWDPADSNIASTLLGTSGSSGIEDGEVIEKKDDVPTSETLASTPAVAAVATLEAGNSTSTSAAPIPAISTTTAVSAATAANSKKKTSSSKAPRATTTTTTTTTKAARAGKGSRGGKGSKAAQAITATTASGVSPIVGVTAVASSVDGSIAALTQIPVATSIPLPPTTQQLSQSLPQTQSQQTALPPQQFPGQQQQFPPFQQQQQTPFQRAGAIHTGLPMSIALPPQGQPGLMAGGSGGSGVLTSQQLMNIMRQQGQNVAMAAAAVAASNGGGIAATGTTVGGIHLPFLNGQQQQPQQYMNPSAFLNNSGNNGFNPGNPMNIHLGQLNNNQNGNNNSSGNSNTNHNAGW
ncbi:RNA polymerase II mediator complex subunit [Mortierella claussenii]|nr:RNA polymerase II mediator complex subunit [Mortierella claussenii]